MSVMRQDEKLALPDGERERVPGQSSGVLADVWISQAPAQGAPTAATHRLDAQGPWRSLLGSAAAEKGLRPEVSIS